ncbi:MAG: ExeM/NucH family extracellular endonuclease [Trueperaceae bacterium]|nr:ExeM/NucH family extracellular endonuclease [Trueperaceae bacterium]
MPALMVMAALMRLTFSGPSGAAPGSCGDAATPMHAVQGASEVSPMEGRSVVVEGGLIGDFQAAEELQGFFVQEADADRDDDPATSEALFVFEGEEVTREVAEGDRVRVAGTVKEYGGMTELTDVTGVTICGEAGQVTPVALRLPLGEAALERVENMRVTFPQALTISGYADFDRFGEITLSHPAGGRPRMITPTAHLDPGDPEAARQVRTAASRRITLDDGRYVQNPDPLRHPDGQAFTQDHRFRGGDLVTDAEGMLTYAFGAYRLHPTRAATYTGTNPRPTVPEEVGGALRVAAVNAHNYFTTLGRRGAQDADALARQRAKLVAMLASLDADVLALVEVENGDGAAIDLISALEDEGGGGSYDVVRTGVLGSDEIEVALAYRPAAVTPVGPHAVLDAPAFLDPNDVGMDLNRPVLAQTFEDARGGVFTVAAVHLKSKGSACGAGDDDPLQGNCNRTRALAARHLSAWLAGDPTGSGDPDALILGDLNAYDQEDPIRALEAGGYTDLLDRHEGAFAYTYGFDAQFGHLDYALANASLAPQVTGATAWHVNADEPDVLDDRADHAGPAQRALYRPDAFRASDHDPVLIGLELDTP